MTTNKITTLAITTLAILGLINSASAEWLNYDYPTTATAKTLMYDKDLHEQYKGFEVLPGGYEGYLHVIPKLQNLLPEEYSEGNAREGLFEMYAPELRFAYEEGQKARFEFVEETYNGDYLRIMNNFFYALIQNSLNVTQDILGNTEVKNKLKIKHYDQQVLKYQRYAKAVKNLSDKISIEKREKMWNQKLLPMLDEKVRTFWKKRSRYDKWVQDQNLDIIFILLEFYRQMDPSEENNYYLTDASKKLIIKHGGIESYYKELYSVTSKAWIRPSAYSALQVSNPRCVYIEKNRYEIKNWKVKTFMCSALYSIQNNDMYRVGNGFHTGLRSDKNGKQQPLEEWNEYDFVKKDIGHGYIDYSQNTYNLTPKQQEERVYRIEINSQDWPERYKKQLINAGWTYDEYNKYAEDYLKKHVWNWK